MLQYQREQHFLCPSGFSLLIIYLSGKIDQIWRILKIQRDQSHVNHNFHHSWQLEQISQASKVVAYCDFVIRAPKYDRWWKNRKIWDRSASDCLEFWEYVLLNRCYSFDWWLKDGGSTFWYSGNIPVTSGMVIHSDPISFLFIISTLNARSNRNDPAGPSMYNRSYPPLCKQLILYCNK